MSALLLLALAAPLAEGPPAAELIAAPQVQAVSEDPAAAAWERLPLCRAWALPQRSVQLHDRQANAYLAKRPLMEVGLRAMHDARTLAVAVEWPDDSESRPPADELGSFSDGAAMELPLVFGPGSRLPYVGMGDEGALVALYFQRATPQGSALKELVAAGIGSAYKKEVPQARAAMAYDPGARRWRAVFVRPLLLPGHDLRRGLVPVAFALWDGARNERGGNKMLTSWKYLRMDGFAADPSYLKERAEDYALEGAADLAKGKALTGELCLACHRLGEKRSAAAGLAPDLDQLGLLATPGYLRDSVADPSRVVVPHPNANQHYQRSATPDAHGAYPNEPSDTWYTRDEGGKAISRMPVFELEPAELSALVAYLYTLGVPRDSAGALRRSP